MIGGLEHLSCEDRLRAALVQPEGGSGKILQLPSSAKKQPTSKPERLFTRACWDRTRENGFKLERGEV